jgi:2-polyprenyl-3-methyl-5-hydroxy-6-metoxy-1,4-benzoquinol methylase
MDVRPNDYDSFAEAYAAENENNLVNAYFERPAMLALAGDVACRHILDAGCGSGPLTAALRDRGAVVTGIDSSAEMLALARRRRRSHIVETRRCRCRDARPLAWISSAGGQSADPGVPPFATASAGGLGASTF